MKRSRKKKILSKRNIIKGTRGVISLFLAMLMVPFTTLAGALLTAARVNSASTIFDEAMSNAADSTLADWDSFLKNRFGLLAVKQDTGSETYDLNKTFSVYLGRNTDVLSNTFFDVKSNCTGMYSLADTDILKYQVLEYSKLSVPTIITFNGLDINGIISSFENLIPGKNWLGFISSGLDMGSAISDLGVGMDNWADAAKEKEQAKSNYDSSYNSFESSASALSAKIAEKERVLAECNSKIASQETAVSNERAEVEALKSKVSANDTKIKSLNQKQSDLNSILNLIENAEKENITLLNESKDLKTEVDKAIDKGYLDLEKDSDDYNNIEVTKLKELVEEEKEAVEKSVKSLTSSSIYKEYTKANTNYEKANQTLTSLKNEKNQKEQDYNNEISNLKQNVNAKKSAYSTDIGTLISKLKNEKTKQAAAVSAVNSALSSFNRLGQSAVSAFSKDDLTQLKKEKQASDAAINEYNETYKKEDYITEDEYNSTVNHYRYVKDLVDESEASKQNMSVIYNASSSALTDAVNAGGEIFNTYNDQYYDALIQQLEGLKNAVNSFSADTITGSFNQTDFKGNYYKNITIVTEEMIDNSQKAILDQLVSDSLWDTIKIMFNAFESLIKMICLYDPALNTNIDTDYYSSIKEGWENLTTGNSADKEKSMKYKDLFGSFGATDLTSDGNFNLSDCIVSVFSDISFIKNKVTGINAVKSLFDFGNTWSQIEEKLSDIKTQFSNMLDWAKNLPNMFYDKTLVAGYLSYSTSCRTTYSSGSSLTGASFNLRSQNTNYENDWQQADGIGDFVSMIGKTFTGDTAKCFVGAEQEYLINGKNSEIKNQLLTFLEIYALRLICDIVPIVTSSEVNAMAACCGPFAFIIYALEILFDPLVDTLLLTSGGSVALIKTQPFLVPSGISSLVGAVTNLALTNAQIASVQQGFVENVNKIQNKVYSNGTESYSVDTDPDKDLKEIKVKSAYSISAKKTIVESETTVNGIKIDDSLTWHYQRELFKFDYQNYLFIYMMFCSSDMLMSRFRDIVEYEATQNLSDNGQNVFISGDNTGQTSGAAFDLANSYTYLRCEADFSTNEFISLSGSNVNMKERLLYRGY